MLDALKNEITSSQPGVQSRDALKNIGYRAHLTAPNVIARAYAIESLFTQCAVRLYDSDRVPGSLTGSMLPKEQSEALTWGNNYVRFFGERDFVTNCDHYAANYRRFLPEGIVGVLDRIEQSRRRLSGNDPMLQQKQQFLEAAQISMRAFSRLIARYGEAAREKAAALEGEAKARFEEMAAVCEHIALQPPKTFHQALTLVWFTYLAFCLEGRYAMAFGRMDQYLFPYYEADLAAGRIDKETATELVASTLIKIGEWRKITGGDDVSNIAIGGVKPEDGSDAVNELTYIILEAVHRCNIPGPNLSLRYASNNPPELLIEALKVIGTGLGYPALMNDDVNVASLARMGYPIEECRDYCMVGCIENFLPGKQPPWSDGRYDAPRYIEATLNHGCSFLDGSRFSIDTGSAEDYDTMDAFLASYKKQMAFYADEYYAHINTYNTHFSPLMYQSPFLSCFCDDCIDRALDINNGGARYPSAHGAACMGVGTVADSLAAMEKVVFIDKECTLVELTDALRRDFTGENDALLRAKLLAAPKYGNADDFVDRYAVWYVEYCAELFDRYRTYDGGRFYIGIASNTSNIPAGSICGATPDGRRAKEPLSDAASPTYGRDKKGPLAVAQSLCKPDYTLVAVGSVINQKYSPSMFESQERLERLAAIIRTYFAGGGQEMQINSVSRDILSDAMDHPENYRSLVVRVSGFSAYYTALERSVQVDILNRTEQDRV